MKNVLNIQFQFQNGSIKRFFFDDKYKLADAFQFQNGSIKS